MKTLFAQETPLPIPAYPLTEKGSQVDDYFGTSVADPYRWLEDDNAARTIEWVKAQNAVTQQYLAQIPYRNTIKERLTTIWDYPKMNTPLKAGNKIFYLYNTGMQNQSALYMQEDLTKSKTLLFDPNKEATDGSMAINQFEPSPDGSLLAIAVSKSGSDWQEIIVMDVKKKKLLSDKIEWVKFSAIDWKGQGFYYSRYDQPKEGTALTRKNEYHKVYYHKMGTQQAKDQLVYQNTGFPLRNFTTEISDDGRYLFVSESESTSGNALYFTDLTKAGSGFTCLYPDFEFDFEVIGTLGNLVILRTNWEAPKYQLIIVDLEVPEVSNYKPLVKESDKMVLESACLIKDHVVVKYLHNATNQIFVHDLRGEVVDKVQLPALGTVDDLHGQASDSLFFYSFTSFVHPQSIFARFIGSQKEFTLFQPKLFFDPNEYETSQVFYPSRDGTQVPMFLVYKSGLQLNGKNPTLLYGYGGFNISLTPVYSPSRMVFIENGGILAIPNIRGGGEFGRDWHLAGTKEKKQVVFDDFIAAANYLIQKSYTSPGKLAISGGSNGGLLVGACMTQRPELFKVALPAVGVLDMLRYHTFTIGWAWKTDYGSSEDKEGFTYLYKYSPLHNIKQGVKYPATLVTTADHDDRVVPAHSFKFIATLQEKHLGDNPVLIRIQTQAGHGAGKPTGVKIEEAADIWAFTFHHLGMKPAAGHTPSPKELKQQKKPAYIDSPFYQQNKPVRIEPSEPQPLKKGTSPD